MEEPPTSRSGRSYKVPTSLIDWHSSKTATEIVQVVTQVGVAPMQMISKVTDPTLVIQVTPEDEADLQPIRWEVYLCDYGRCRTVRADASWSDS